MAIYHFKRMRVDFIHADPINRKHTHTYSFFLVCSSKIETKIKYAQNQRNKKRNDFPFRSDWIGMHCMDWIGLDLIQGALYLFVIESK